MKNTEATKQENFSPLQPKPKIVSVLPVPMGSDDRTKWANKVSEIVGVKLNSKFIRGQKEHMGDIGDYTLMELANHMEEEAMDLIWYVQEFKRRLQL